MGTEAQTGGLIALVLRHGDGAEAESGARVEVESGSKS